MTRVRVRTGGQNMTEGPLTPVMAGCHVVIGQEVDRHKVRQGLPHHLHHFPELDPHQSISWDPRVLRRRAHGYIRFHRSGAAEDWPFGSPARGLIWDRFDVLGTDVELVVGGLWWLNSWDPVEEDAHTALRRRIVRETTIPRVRSFVHRNHAKGRVVYLEGDINSVKWPGHLHGMEQVHDHGLERAWVSDDPRVRPLALPMGPRTGVGSQLRHQSVHTSLGFAA